MTESRPPPRTAAALATRRGAAQAMLQRVGEALRQMRREQTRITYAAAARRADVSRTFLYQNPAAHQLMTDAITDANGHRTQQANDAAARTESSWRERALNAEDALTAAHAEIRTQRGRIGELLGRIRDLEHDLPADAVQRLVTENTTLKQQNRQLADEHKTTAERLKASRDNGRFADRRIAQLEAQLLEQSTNQHYPPTSNPGCSTPPSRPAASMTTPTL